MSCCFWQWVYLGFSIDQMDINKVIEVDILAVGVHPDDVELMCSGTLLKHIAAGFSVGILDLSLGELGTRGNANIRTQEAFAAAKIMKAKFRTQLNLADVFFEYSESSLRAIIQIIRECRPKIVLINAKTDRHPDHGRAAVLVKDACYYSGLIKIETEWASKRQKEWRPQSVYHCIQDQFFKPDFVVDITDFIEAKMNLITTFKSQFYDPNSTEPNSPISSKDFLDAVKAQAKVAGRYVQKEYAEGFHITRPIEIQNLFHII